MAVKLSLAHLIMASSSSAYPSPNEILVPAQIDDAGHHLITKRSLFVAVRDGDDESLAAEGTRRRYYRPAATFYRGPNYAQLRPYYY